MLVPLIFISLSLLANHRIIECVDGSRMNTKFCKDILIGEVIRISNGQVVPADILILSTANQDGASFVETLLLDGYV